jgi:hypothetical protein
MFTACYDNRPHLPREVLFFLDYTATRLPLSLLWASTSRRLPRGLRHHCESKSLHIVPTDSIPYYNYVVTTFDSVYTNYSTNPDSFERACFYRWFALNSASSHLQADDLVCLLDTDFLVGLTPFDLYNLCSAESSYSSIDLISDWDPASSEVFCPAFTIIRKAALYDFCKYLLTFYFSPENKSILLGGYFERIAAGLPGGICDMRALASWCMQTGIKSFNLRTSTGFRTISSVNQFIEDQANKGIPWEIRFFKESQELVMQNSTIRLAGTHFQGDAKCFLRSFSRNIQLPLVLRHDLLSNPSFIKNLRIRHLLSRIFINQWP